MIRIIVDCFGSDKAPEAQIEGSLMALKAFSDVEIILTGDEKIIKQHLEGKVYDAERLTLVHAPEVVEVNEKPTDVIRLKRESSMIKGIRMLREDDSISGMVSAGSSGAFVAASMLRIGRLKNVIRPAFCPVLPTMDGKVVGICDSGANVDITPEHLLQYGIMAGQYMKYVYGVENPRVALLNIGVESDKGDDLRKEAYKLLEENESVNFVGNMESRDLLSGKYDLVVCDGFSGNVLVKTTEGTAVELLKKLKKDIGTKLKYKLGALLMYKMFMEEKEFMNYQNYGGSVLLGLEKVVVKGHGSSGKTAIYKCIEQVYKARLADMNAKTEELLPEYVK